MCVCVLGCWEGGGDKNFGSQIAQEFMMALCKKPLGMSYERIQEKNGVNSEYRNLGHDVT